VQGPARVIRCELSGARSPIQAPSPMSYLDVRLAAGEVWCYVPPKGHDVAWIAVHEGQTLAPQAISAGELAVFEQAQTAITFRAEAKTSFVLGSAVKHPHDLVLGYYSVHTTDDALAQGESNIRRIAEGLRLAGKLLLGPVAAGEAVRDCGLQVGSFNAIGQAHALSASAGDATITRSRPACLAW
jgi:hypothetical protein